MSQLPTSLTIYRRVFGEAKPFGWHLAGILLISLLATPFTLLTPLPLAIVVDSVLGAEPLPAPVLAVFPGAATLTDGQVLGFAAGLAVAIAGLSKLRSLGASLLTTYTAAQLVLNFRARLFRHAQRLSLTYHDTRGTYDTVYRVQHDAPAVQWIAIDGVIPFVTAVVTLVSMLYVTLRIHAGLALVALVVAPILFGLSRLYSRQLRHGWRGAKKLDSAAFSVVQEVLNAVRVVKAFGQEDREEERFVRQANRSLTAKLRLAAIEGALNLLVALTTAIGTAAVLVIGAQLVQRGELSLGALLLVLGYLAQLYKPLESMSQKVASLQGSLASAERAFGLLDEEQDVVELRHARPLQRARGAISFEHVSFGYEGGRQVLKEVSFSVPAGARVGIAGATGAGKTTLISLMMRFYDPDAGWIALDGVSLRRLKLRDLRSQFALVLQEPVLFSASIAENIAYARPGAPQQAIVAAARAADAHDFISALPDGYDTMVGERGMRLSGGERQRISLARAFLKDAPILILDEPTSAVDLKTEATIMAALERLMEGRTSFMIAHRLSTLERCTIRLELADGRLIQAGGQRGKADGYAAA